VTASESTSRLPDRVDLAVVGGGVCGSVCAAEAARRGARVAVLEKEAEVAEEGSGRSFGSLRVQGRHPAETPLAVDAIELWREAARTIGVDFELVQGGNLYVAEHEAEVDQLRQQLVEARAAGLADVRLLGPEEVREIVPCLTRRVAAGLYSARDAHCDPRKATRAYAALAEKHGAQIAVGTRAVDLLVADGKIAGVRTERGDVRARAVVVAAGVWTPRLVRRLGIRMRGKEGRRAPHTLNGTAFAIGRTIAAILENFQEPSGEVAIPEVLHPHLPTGMTMIPWKGAGGPGAG